MRNTPKPIVGPDKVKSMGNVYPLIVKGKEVEADYLGRVQEAEKVYQVSLKRAEDALESTYKEINNWYEGELKRLYDK